MTVTVNQDCSLITFTSNYFTTNLTSLELKIKYNCSSTPLVINGISKIVSIVNNSFTLNPTEYYYPTGLPSGTTAPTKFCDGIYYFEIKSTSVTSEGDVDTITSVTQSDCALVDCDLRCKLIENYKEDNIEEMFLFYNALKVSTECDDCSCTSSCEMYIDLKNMLNIITTTTNDTGCGC